MPARRCRTLPMSADEKPGRPLWNGMCIVTARRGRLPGLSWMRSDEPILFRVSGFCPAVFAVRSGRAGFGRTAGRTGPDSGRAIARHSFAPVRARDGKPRSRRSGPGGCADRPVGTGRSRKSIRAARLRLLRRVRWSGARCSGKRRLSVRAEWLRQDTNDPRRGWIRSEFRPIQPSPASAAHAFSTIGAVSVKARPSESGYSSRMRTSSSASFSRSVR